MSAIWQNLAHIRRRLTGGASRASRSEGPVGGPAPAVTRRPAGVYTPETWQIEVLGADCRTQRIVERAIHGGGLA